MSEAPVEQGSAVLWPTLTPSKDSTSLIELRAPTSKDGALAERAYELDAIITDAAQDLGLSLDIGAKTPRLPGVVREADLIAASRTSHAWVISPRIERDGGQLLIRLVAVPPDSKVALVREERTTPEGLALQVVVMLRDIVNAHSVKATSTQPESGPRPAPDESPDAKGRAPSSGRAVLMATMAIYGGYIGYGLQKASRGDDPRLLYPMMAIGAGVGLGAATIVADEWDVGVGDAWYLAAGAFWPAASALMLTTGYDLQPSGDRHAFALLSGIGGMGIATAVLAQKSIGEGPALLTHSGAALGGFLGGLSELAIEGTTEATPYKGIGYGVGAGLLLSGTAAAFVNVSANRIQSADLGAGIGALAGAAAASPLLLEDTTEARQRVWLLSTMAGTLLGAGAGLWLSAPSSKPATGRLPTLPAPSIVGYSQTRSGAAVPVPGLLWSGRW